MEAYYDSDDDVCWGPYTRREFKRNVLRPKSKEDIISRHSVSCDPRFNYDIDKRGESLTEPDSESQSPLVFATDSEEFIEKNSQILNDIEEDCEQSEASTYNTSKIHDEQSVKVCEKTLERSDLYFSAKSDLSKMMHEDKSFITCSFASEINGSIESIASNVDSYVNSPVTSEVEVNTSANCSYKKDEDETSEIHTINDSEDSNASFKFNDTLEEIERLLNEGLDYGMSDVKQENKSQSKVCIPSISLIPVPCKNKSTGSMSACSSATENPCATNEFKIPEKPKMKQKFHSPAQQKDRFRNIKSPIAIYIKNTPTVPLYKKLTPKKCKKEHHENTTPLSEKQNKENDNEFPNVIYQQPKKRTITNVQSAFKLPNKIESLITGQNYVIKHDVKIGGKENSVTRRLLEEDLTINTTTDENSFNCSTENMSICTSKRAFI